MITTVAPRATFHDRTPLSPQPPSPLSFVMAEALTKEQFENGKAIHPARPFYELRCVNLQSIRFDGDRAGSEAEALKAHGVVKIIAFDGFVSLWLFNARGSTRDLDNYLPGPFKNETYQGTATDMMLKLEDLIHKVARDHRLDEGANTRVTTFIDGSGHSDRIVSNSLQQGPILYSSPQLEIYTGDMVFQLAQKVVTLIMRSEARDAVGAGHICEPYIQPAWHGYQQERAHRGLTMPDGHGESFKYRT